MSRIPEVTPPYSKEVSESFAKLMPEGLEPLRLFRVLAHNPRVLRKMQRGSLLDEGAVSVRIRELVILRSCALCGARYEWGVHASYFGPKAELSDEELDATWHEGSSSVLFRGDDRLVLALAEVLHAKSELPDALYEALAARFPPPALVELVMLAGLYHAISYVVNAFAIEDEPFARQVSSAKVC